MYDALHRRSKELMRRDSVLLDASARQVAGRALVEMLDMQAIQVIAVSLDARHYHILAKFPDTNVRPIVGRAKKHAYHELRNRGHEGAVWATRNRVLPVRNREHQVNVFRYIVDHRKKGAWVWTFREGIHWRKPGAPGLSSHGAQSHGAQSVGFEGSDH
jgi:REP element-mobilizing transposase RayT